MGRHASLDQPDAETVQLRVAAPESEPTPLLPTWFLMSLVAGVSLLALIALVVIVTTATGSAGSIRTTATPAPTDWPAWDAKYATPGWANGENRYAFGVAMNGYLARYGEPSAPATLDGAAISDCIALRASRPDQVHGAPGETSAMVSSATEWAVLNAGIDVYCPDQAAQRNVLPTPTRAAAPSAPPTTYAPNLGDDACANRAQSVFTQLATHRLTLAQAEAQLPAKVPASALVSGLQGVQRLEVEGASVQNAVGQASGTIAQSCEY